MNLKYLKSRNRTLIPQYRQVTKSEFQVSDLRNQEEGVKAQGIVPVFKGFLSVALLIPGDDTRPSAP